jgi:putative ABC transport system permease protein
MGSSAWGRWARIWSFATRGGVEREVEEELGFHLEMLIEEYESRGLGRDEARRRAERRFGEMARVRQDAVRAESARVRAQRRSSYLDGVRRDLRYAVRTLGRHPTFAATAVLVLAIGIGATSAIFSAANAFLFRPLPFGDADRLVMLYETNPEFGWTHGSAAPANALDWREQVGPLEDIALFSDFVARSTFVRDGEPTLLGTTNVTGNFFSVLGVAPELGRTFRWEETWQGSDAVAVLSHAAWREVFGSDPGIVGRTIEVGTTELEVVGVMPARFTFPSDEVQLWTPWGWDPADRDATWFRRAHWVRPVARLAPGATVPRAAAALQVVVDRLQAEYPETNRVMGAGLMPVRDFLVMDVRRPLQLLLGAVLLLLALACADVANLLLVRADDRGREVAVRFALGAGRGRVARLLLTEGLVLAGVGGALGLGLGWIGVRAIAAVRPIGIEGATSLALDGRVLLFTLATSVLCGLAFGLAPALRTAPGGEVQAVLKEGGSRGTAGRRRMRTVNALVALEVALAMVLAAGAGLMVRSFWHLRNVDPGVRTENVLAVEFTIPSSRYPDRDAVLAFQDVFQERLEARPGIERVGLIGHLPLAGPSWSSQFQAAGWPPERVGLEIVHRRADAAYFDALDVPLLDGRMFGPEDGADAPNVVVINETLAAEHFPGEDPIGQRIAYDRVATEESIWYRIIGIVGDQLQVGPAEPARAEVFENRRQDWNRTNWFVIRTAGDAAGATSTARAVLHQLDPLVPLARVRALREVWRDSMARQAFVLTLLAAFGAMALLLAAVGVYGVTAQAARRRTHEIGIRMALGAGASAVVGLMVRQGLRVVGVGLAAGLAGALALTGTLDSFLYGVPPNDPATLAAVAALLAAVAGLASFLPARRATRSDPARTLRTE